MTFLTTYLYGGLAIGAMITLLWVVSLLIRNSAIIDTFWSIGFLLSGAVYLSFGNLSDERALLLYGLMLLWGIRLSLHILIRSWGKPEDARYNAWRREAGKSWWWRSFFKVFLTQGVIAWLLSLPFAYTLAKSDGGVLVWHDWLGVGLFAIGFIFEAVGDAHLYFFKRNPENKGKVLDRGLWSLTRHPNYFGEAVLWWGFFAIAIPAAPLWTVFSPIVMTYLLVRVSGVKMLDELLARTKPGYREYMERTSGFVPWPKGGSNMKAKRIRKWLLGLGVLAAAGSMGCSSHQPLISADYVDLDQFMGDWYVIANIPTPPEKNAVNALEQYARKPNGDIDITFSFNKGDVTAKRKVMHAKGFVQEGSGNARWKVQFIWPLRFPYYVMEVDPEYQYTVIGLPSRKYLWIMARESSIPDSTYQSILTRVQQAGYDTSAIQMVPQEW